MTEPELLRLAQLVARARAAGEVETPRDDLWPGIRDRIEGAKLVELPPTVGHPLMRRARIRRSFAWFGAAVAAGLVVFALGRSSGRFGSASTYDDSADAMVVSVADSSGVYAEQTRILFNRLSLERSLVRPEALRLIDRDLRVVDSAIAELNAAVKRDPYNPILRRLLVSSYRGRVDILKRVENAE